MDVNFQTSHTNIYLIFIIFFLRNIVIFQMTITRCRASSSGWLQHEQCSSGETGRSLFLKMSKKYISQTSNLLNLADEPTVKPFELN